jgi:MFS family permease
MNSTAPKINKFAYLGIFFVAFSTLMYQILLTRIFSVTMGYHFAFMAVSIAMFGMTVGAIIVYVLPNRFPQERIYDILAKQSLYFSITTILSFLIHLFIPFIHGMSILGISVTAFIYAEISVPFIFSGICISLLLTRFPESVNKLYASDLIGASLGCVLVVIVLNVSGGPTGVFVTALFSAFAAIMFLKNTVSPGFLKKGILIYTLLIAAFAGVHSVLVNENNALLRLFWIRGEWAEKPLYEKWNSFSRVSIDGDSTKFETPFGWGLSNKYDRSRKIRQLMLNIDAHSTTVLSHFDGDTSELSHLKYDVSNLAQYLRPNGDVLIIGSGAGRDVLSSLAFGQKSILGIEINKDMIRAINGEFGDFTGHLDKYPNVEFVGDEARSYIQRLDKEFDIIQVSVIDNWSAAASGAFVLTENALYTVETWKLLLSKLKPDGILTVTRFFRSTPVEHYRLMNICADALNQSGFEDIRSRVMLIKCQQEERIQDRSGTGTMLISKTPFSPEDIAIVDSLNAFFEFENIISPGGAGDSVFAMLTSSPGVRDDFNRNFPVDITSPTDDKPFFFHYMKFTDLPNRAFWNRWDMAFNAKAVFILLTLAGTMAGLSFLCIVVPLKLTSKKTNLKGTFWYFTFFTAIGLGFMLIEISQIQRLNIFLGHPTYSIAAALFTMLLSSGIGSYLSGTNNRNLLRGSLIRFGALISVLILFGTLTPYIITAFREYSTIIRVLVSVIILFPMGLFLGMAFPIGMKLASGRKEASGFSITPWLWGINGVMSVLATVISIIIAMNYGISASYWVGAVFYVLAVISFLMISLKVRYA